MTKQHRFSVFRLQIRSWLRKRLLYVQRTTTFRDWLALAVLVAILFPIGFYLGLYQFQNATLATLRQQLAPPAPIAAPINTQPHKKPMRPLPNIPTEDYAKATLKNAILSIEEKAIAHTLLPLEGTPGIRRDENKDPEKPSRTVTAYHIIISMVGTYADIGEFLFSLYELPIVTVLDEVALKPEEGSDRTILNAKMTLYLYGDAQ